MIHQFIFAAPKPGLSAAAFQSYWVNFHAVDYAAKIPQIRQYLVATKLPLPIDRPLPIFEGAAEIWLANEQEQIASLQTRAFLNGARADEPRWAAFWLTLVLDTDPHILRAEAVPHPHAAKLYLLHKRRPELSRADFQTELTATRQKRENGDFEEAVGHVIGFARPGLYGIGEPRFDAIETVTFATKEVLDRWLTGCRFCADFAASSPFTDKRYLFAFAAEEHWIIKLRSSDDNPDH